MQFSYSRVSTFNQCPRKFKYRYLDKLETIPDLSPSNALILGTAMHKGIETTVEEGVQTYLNSFYVVNDEIINWALQLEYWIPRVKALLPSRGSHEVEMSTDEFLGYADYVTRNTIWDFKFSNNIAAYLKSHQLSIYKHYFELLSPNRKIKHLKYVFIPKVMIRQKRNETVQQFRERLYAEMESREIQIVEVPFDETSILYFADRCKAIEDATEWETIPSRLCDWCEYQRYCQNGEDWMIL